MLVFDVCSCAFDHHVVSVIIPYVSSMTAWAEMVWLFRLIESIMLSRNKFSDCGMRPEPADPIRTTLQLIVKSLATDRQDTLTSL